MYGAGARGRLTPGRAPAQNVARRKALFPSRPANSTEVEGESRNLRTAIERRLSAWRVTMKRALMTSAIIVLVFLSVGLGAQGRGGGGRGGTGGGGGTDNPNLPLTAYDSTDYGIKFPAPPDFSIFTPQKPGRFRQVFTGGRVIYLVDLMGVNASVTVRFLPKATEADVTGFKNSVDSNPPQAKLPEYKKISVAVIKIGSARDKDAIDYVYTAKDKDTLTTVRQVVFVHNGNGFIFNCSASEKDFASIDKKSFQRLFASIEFK